MRFVQLLFALTFCLYSCSGQANHDLKIPDKVYSTRDASSQQFPGTRIFIKSPNGYQLVQQLIRFQKNNATFLQVYEVPFAAFDAQQLKQQFAEKRQSGQLAKEYYQKEFRFGNYNAMLIYGPDNKPNMDQMALCFGDNSFVVMAIGELSTGDKIARDEILRSLLTIYVDTTIVADGSVLATYILDVTNTEFKYVGNMSQTYFYNFRGSKLNADDEFANQIMVSTFPSQSNAALKEFAISMIERYKTNGMKIPDYKARETTLNGNYAYKIEFNGEFKGKPNSVYQVVTSNANGAVLFCGSAYDNRAKLLTQIKTIAGTLRPK